MPGQLEARRATRRQIVGSDRVDLLPVDDLDTGKPPVKKDREKMLDQFPLYCLRPVPEIRSVLGE